MQPFLVALACALSLAWLPIAYKFQASWRARKNPVSLAICATALLLAYSNIIFGFAVMGETTWRFYAIATHVFELVIVVNFYVSFQWANRKFPGNRRSDSAPPSNTTSTPRQP